jgi:ribosome maturation factor RimP
MSGPQALEHEVESCLSRALPGVDLLEVTLLGGRDSGTLRVVIDHPAGVDHALCVQTTRALEGAGLRDRYAIEVSSPGPDRPLRTLDHYRRAIGERVRLRVAGDGPGSRRSRTGTLLEATDGAVRLAGAEGEVEIPAGSILRARVIPTAE